MLSTELIEQIERMDVREIIQLYSIVEKRYDEFKRTVPSFATKKWEMKDPERARELRRDNARAFRARQRLLKEKETKEEKEIED